MRHDSLILPRLQNMVSFNTMTAYGSRELMCTIKLQRTLRHFRLDRGRRPCLHTLLTLRSRPFRLSYPRLMLERLPTSRRQTPQAPE